MLHEYAVDPGCLGEWDVFIRLTEQFGIPHGRLISRFPKSWLKEVDAACKEFTFVQRQRMAVVLEKLKRHALIRSSRSYNASGNWIDNAVEQHRTCPFHAVISDRNEKELDFVLVAKEIFSDTPLWKVPKDAPIPRTAVDLSAAVGSLLQMSKRILFVDKMFEPGTPRWKEALSMFVQASLDGSDKPPQLEYHVQYDHRNQMDRTEFEGYCAKSICGLLPSGVELSICRWDRKPGGEGIHARYILTERGGIRVDWGLDTGRDGETTDVSLMDCDLWEKRWNDYQESSGVFELIDKVVIRGKR